MVILYTPLWIGVALAVSRAVTEEVLTTYKARTVKPSLVKKYDDL
jgi:hypothetical protein